MTADQVHDWSPGRPQAARIYDYLLGGKDNYKADEEAAEKLKAVLPAIATAARVNRAFMRRAVHFLASEVGIRQFLDIGTGIPTEPNLHQVVQAVAPECRVVYADNDPVVLIHAQTLVISTPEGRTTYIHSNVTEPDTILDAPELKETLDLSQPVALSLLSLLHLISDERDAYGIVNRLLAALPSGSALAISHVTGDLNPEAVGKAEKINRAGGIDFQVRSKTQIERFFTGLEVVEPGITVPHRWRPDSTDETAQIGSAEVRDADVSIWAGVAIKP